MDVTPSSWLHVRSFGAKMEGTGSKLGLRDTGFSAFYKHLTVCHKFLKS